MNNQSDQHHEMLFVIEDSYYKASLHVDHERWLENFEWIWIIHYLMTKHRVWDNLFWTIGKLCSFIIPLHYKIFVTENYFVDMMQKSTSFRLCQIYNWKLKFSLKSFIRYSYYLYVTFCAISPWKCLIVANACLVFIILRTPLLPTSILKS